MRRGDLVTVTLRGEQGKPRPALVVQADHFSDLPAVTVLPITSTLIDAPLLRVPGEPSAQNGLATRSQVMVDKPQTPPRGRIGEAVGHLDDATMLASTAPWRCSLGSPDPARACGSQADPALPCVHRMPAPPRRSP